ncbi:MAG: asparagine synthase (glutamine-hydrolyzing) [Steroidobacteraceae bacterium]
MCGIAGRYGPRLDSVAGDAGLREMLRALRHRGPDEAGMYLSERLCMGTVRLSIVGISSGQQPVCDEAGRYCLCYNGEVYNHIELRRELAALGYRFVTNSDTEVVLQAWRAWGDACLLRLNGPFAFALYDSLEDTLYLVRDRYGKRPLFYARHGDDLLFASEMKAFLAVADFPFEFDPQQLSSVLTLWTPLGEQSSFKQVKQVPQGCYVELSRERISLRRYYEQDFASSFSFDCEQQAIASLGVVLRNAVELRLRSEVEVGMYLSGGLDSSILASILAEQVDGRLRTYSVTFDDTEFDESADQLTVASHVDSRHRALHVTDDMIVSHFPAAAFHAEVPLFRTALVPMYLLSRMVHDDGIKVVMTGEGADEAFLGYDLFKETLLRRDWNALSEAEKIERLGKLYPYLRHYRESGGSELLGLYQQFSVERFAGLFSHELRIQNGLFSRRLLRVRGSGLDAVQELIAQHPYFPRLSSIEKAQWLEYQTLLPGYLLSSQGDRMALAHSVENRCPFLDPRVVELSAAANLKFDDGADEKYLLRKAFFGQLPPAILAKRKYPYRAPDARAFVRGRPEYLELILSDSELRKNDILDAAFCRRLVDKIFRAAADRVSTKEDQAFIFLLSTCILHHQFVRRRALGTGENRPVDDIIVRVVDARGAPARQLRH